MATVRITFSELGKRFGSRIVLRGLSGELRPHCVVAVTGPNGSGKSTLLNLLAGVMRPSSGTVAYLRGDRPVPRHRWHGLLGVAAPDMAVYEELTALENLRFFARLRGLAHTDGELARLLGQLGLASRDVRRPVATFSSGMKQRVKLAQAVVHEPAVLLLDEPSSNLDEEGHATIAALVARFRGRAALAIATNDPREMAWGDERIHLGN
jgi:heme exporter protein A